MGKLCAALAVALLFLPTTGHSHMSDECFAHVSQMQEELREAEKANREISRLSKLYEDESVEALRSGTPDGIAAGFSRLMFIQLPTLIDGLHHSQRLSMDVIESAVAAIGCTVNEPKPVTTHALVAPVDPEWLDEVMSGLNEQDPPPIELGVDCTKPFTVSLPDDVLTECEAE